MRPIDIREAMYELFALFEEKAGERVPLARLSRALDRLAHAMHFVPKAFDARDHPEPPDHDHHELMQTVAERFPELGWYYDAEPLSSGSDGAVRSIGDANDDLADILSELRQVEWRWQHTSEADALRYLRLSYRDHWEAHLRGLQLHLMQIDQAAAPDSGLAAGAPRDRLALGGASDDRGAERVYLACQDAHRLIGILDPSSAWRMVIVKREDLEPEPGEVHGTFAVVGAMILGIFRHAGELYLLWDGEALPWRELRDLKHEVDGRRTVLEVETAAGRRSHSYATIRIDPPIDPVIEPFVEEEDFDIGRFLAHVFSDSGRQRRVFRGGGG